MHCRLWISPARRGAYFHCPFMRRKRPFSFSVESVEPAMQDIDRVVGMKAAMHASPLGSGTARQRRLELAHHQFPMADPFASPIPTTTLIALRERTAAA